MAKGILHRGKLLEKVVKSSGIKIEIVTKKAGYSRTSYYNHIKEGDLSINILMQYGRPLNYDFSNDIPEMEALMLLDNPQPSTLPQAIKEIEKWRNKYYMLMEKYNELLERR